VLPALAESVFADGAVAAAVADDPATDGATEGIVPDKISVVTGPNSITMVVQARDADPATAARLADVAAAAFTAELNRPGSGVGQFAVQADAVIPATPLQVVSDTVRAGLGALAGLVLGLGFVALITVVRRPSVTTTDVMGAVGVPLLGTVQLRRSAPGTFLGPRGVTSIGTVTRWLATAPPGRLILVSSPKDAGTRQRIFVMVAIALTYVRSLRLHARPGLVAAVQRGAPVGRGKASSARPRDTRTELTLVDGGSPLEILDPTATPVSVVGVARVGISRGRLRAMLQDYQGAGLVGVILVKHRRGLRRINGISPAPLTPPREARPAGDVSEREPAV
jgi:hypothetical protein